jgi:putative redox protein
MTTIKAVLNDERYATHLFSATNEMVADEPLSAGGKDKGFSPDELLSSALAACTSITLRMYADRKQWPLEKTEIHVTLERDAVHNITKIKRDIQLYGNLTGEQVTRLLEIANQCPIHKTLSNPIIITTGLL